MLCTYASDHGVQVECRGGVTTGRGQGQYWSSDVHVSGETRVGQWYEQQRPAETAQQPCEHTDSHRARLSGRFQHVTHQTGAELRQWPDSG